MDPTPKDEPSKHAANDAARPTVRRVASLSEVRKEVLQAVLWLVVLCGTVPAAFGVYDDFSRPNRSMVRGLFPVFIWLFGLALALSKINYFFRAFALISALFLIGASEVIWYGAESNGPIFLLSFVVFSAIFYGRRAGVASVVVASALYWVAGWQELHDLPEAEFLDRLTQEWLTTYLSFLFLGVSAQFVIALLFRNVDHSLRTSNALVTELEQEITERQHAQAALMRSESRYRLMADQTSQVIFECDDTGRILYLSPSAERVLGWKMEEMTGASFPSALASGEQHAQLVPEFEDLRLGKTAYLADDIEMTRKDGVRVWCELRAFRVDSGPVEPACIHGVIRDVSWRKDLEDRLISSHKMEAIGLLAGGIAHDFNNLLAAILGSAELLAQDRTESARDVKSIQTIIDCAQRGATLTRELLNFARRGKTQHLAIDLHLLLNHVTQILLHSIDRRIAIRTVWGAEHATVIGDPDQIQNSLLNLCINARDAMPEGGELLLETHAFIPDRAFLERRPRMRMGEHIAIRVADTGHGIAPEITDRIFDPFFTTKPIGKGSGLGLSSVMGCAESHCGCIEVESQPDKGTAFTLYLPIEEPATIGTVPVTAPMLSGHGERLLVVDDEPTIADTLNNGLLRRGYDVQIHTDPREALDWFRLHGREIDLAILDMNMPGMSGLELLRELKQIQPGLAALFFSGYAGDEQKKEAAKEGVSVWIEKPVRQHALLEAIRGLLEAKKAEAE